MLQAQSLMLTGIDRDLRIRSTCYILEYSSREHAVPAQDHLQNLWDCTDQCLPLERDSRHSAEQINEKL
uniref:Uncharacterized protein n=1 Tax=Manihot esculenta TaxID=3983 RepID=A0A2C9UJ11_MANES